MNLTTLFDNRYICYIFFHMYQIKNVKSEYHNRLERTNSTHMLSNRMKQNDSEQFEVKE